MALRAIRTACLLACSLVPALPAAGQELRFRSGALPAAAPGERPSRAALVRVLEQGGRRHLVARFERALTAQERSLWSAAGLELGRSLGGGDYFARVAARLDSAALARLPGLRELHETRREWKLHPELLAGGTPEHTVVARAADGEPTVAVYLLLQEGETLERGDQLVRAAGGSVLDALESVNGLVALVPRSRVEALADADPVLWIEPALPRLETIALNDSNRAITQVDTVQAAPYGLDGSGVTVLVYDGGTARATHVDFGGRLTVRDFSGMIDHATHVAGTIGGSGAASAGLRKGMAPGVTIQSYGFEYDGTGVFLFTNPGDIESDYDEAINVYGADVSNNSIGSNTESNGFHCPIQGDYCVTASLIDAIVGGSLGSPFRVVWANGNERQGSRCDLEGFGDYYSTAPPACAKNQIAVGALNSNDDSMTSFSSWGPTDDGRLRPDVSAPGCQAGNDGGVTSCFSSSDSAYGTYCGTSMASPTVCGIAALLIEDQRAHFGGPDMRNSTLKALLAHTAFDRGNAGPDYQFGYGSVRAQAAVDQLRTGRFLEGEIAEQGASERWSLSVAPGAPELRLTLAWDDVPGAPGVLGALVNDLDLVLLDPNGVRQHVWTLDPLDPSAAAVRTQPDHLNNLEQVLVSAPLPGTWQVEVRGHSVPVGPQSFSLVSSHDLSNAPHVQISFPSELPAVLTPGVATTVSARIVAVNDTLLAGTPTLHVQYGAGPILAFAMGAVGGDLFEAELPPPACGAVPSYHFSAQGATSGLALQPPEAPAATFGALVATTTTVFADDFQANTGWSVVNESVADGQWGRGNPAGDGTRGDPLFDFDGSGQCYVTDNVIGNSDVDGGPTRLLSPVFDCSSGDAFEISYARWFTNDDNDADAMVVAVSNDGGTSWTTVETVSDMGGGWVARSFLLGDYLAPTGQVRLRFSVTDNPNDSVTEAGLDAVRVERRECTSSADCNGNGIVDTDDIASGRSLDDDLNGIPDECAPPDPGDKKRGAGAPGAGGGVQVP